MTWEIVAGIIALVGLIISVVTPIALNQNMARNEERITHHGKQIDDHEHRITVLEQKEEAHENG